ncbi:MAG: ABC transporter ATP-binding protein [Rikenellaceae bacterium]
MFKTYLKLLEFASPLSRYAVPYFIYAVLYAIFNTFNYAMIIPILQTMFVDGGFEFTPLHTLPPITFTPSTYYDVINYLYTQLFGETFTVSNMLIMLATITVMMSLLSNTFRYLCAYTVENMRTRSLQKLRNRLFDHVMGMNVGYFNESRKGDILSKITGDVNIVQFCITNTLQVMFREPFLVVGYLSAMIAISWQLSVFSAIFLPCVALVIGSIVKRLRHPAKRSMEVMADMVTSLDESLSGVKVIKSYNATGYVKEKYHQLNDHISNLLLSMARRQQLASPASEVMGITAIGIIIVFGGTLVQAGELDAAQFLAFIAIFSQITRPVRSFIDQFANINQGVAAGERVLGLLEEVNPLEDRPDAVEMSEFKSTIEFRNVSFSYDGVREVLSGVNFTINRGETVALVGPSGSGKSTISELIPRFYDPTSGEILIDGTPLRNIKKESLRNHVGTVAQDTILFNDSILGNLSFGRRDATEAEIVEAAKIANADTFIRDTPEGYDTNIGDRGMKLSGGQRQRLSIARAVLKNPAILILDEATSALDTESEKLVQESLTKLLEGRTSIVVAHRLSTIYNADKILVVDRGEIVEVGTHTELMSRGGLYSKLVDMQSFE